MPIPKEAADRLIALLRQFTVEAAKALEHTGPDEVHDLRVSIRRLAQGLSLFEPWVPRRPAKLLRKSTKGILKSAGDVRDCDIALELARTMPLTLASEVVGELKNRREQAAESLRARVAAADPAAAFDRWAKDLRLTSSVPGGWEEIHKLAIHVLPDLSRRFIQTGARLAHHPHSKRRLHAFRISAKKLRYSLERFSDLYGKVSIEKRIDAVRKVQTVLGNLNDRVATRRLLRDLGVSQGQLLALHADEERLTAHFKSVWTRLFTDGVAEDWSRFLEQPRGRPRPVAARKQISRERRKAL